MTLWDLPRVWYGTLFARVLFREWFSLVMVLYCILYLGFLFSPWTAISGKLWWVAVILMVSFLALDLTLLEFRVKEGVKLEKMKLAAKNDAFLIYYWIIPWFEQDQWFGGLRSALWVKGVLIQVKRREGRMGNG